VGCLRASRPRCRIQTQGSAITVLGDALYDLAMFETIKTVNLGTKVNLARRVCFRTLSS